MAAKGRTIQAPVTAQAVAISSDVAPIKQNATANCRGERAQLRRNTQDFDKASMPLPQLLKPDD
jgi:hypothetical protein